MEEISSPESSPRPSGGMPPWLLPVVIGCLALPLIIVTVVFVAIVAAIAIPGLVTARQAAREAAARAELSSVMVAMETYATENGRYPGSLAELRFPDDPRVVTTILSADEFDYEICSRHEDSPIGWRVRASAAEAIVPAPDGC